MKITKENIRNYFNTNAYKRGLSYYNSGEVVSCKVNSSNLKSVILSGEVNGSYGEIYKQNINITLTYRLFSTITYIKDKQQDDIKFKENELLELLK